MNRNLTIGIAVIAALSAQSARGRILNVPDDYQTIQAAIDAAENSDTVLVEPGRYEETITFSGNNIVVASLYLTTEDEEIIAATVIDGSIGDGHSTVAIRDGEGEGAELAGFTITGGDTDYGGGVYCTGTAPYLHHLIIEGNEASRNGGGLYTTRDARAICRNLIIRNNRAVQGGGGITCYYSAVTTVEDCIISGNESGYGAGVQCSQSAELIMRGSTIADNVAREGEGAGGLWAWINASVTLQNCTITGNQHDIVPGIYTYLTGLTLDHVLFTGNEGGMVINHYSGTDEHLLRIDNITVSDNATGDWEVLQLDGPGMTIANSILLRSDDRVPIIYLTGDLSISYTLIDSVEDVFSGRSDPELGDGNIAGDPLFVDRENGDYHLQPDSPCIDAGDPEAEPDPDGTRRDMGALAVSQRNVWLGGRIIDIQNGEEIPEARVTIRLENGWQYRRYSDADGLWGGWIGLPQEEGGATVSVVRDPYTPWEQDIQVRRDDSLFIETRLGCAVLEAPEDTLAVGVVEGEPATLPVELHNVGSVPLIWSAEWQGTGNMASVPGETIQTVNIGQILGASRLFGVAFDGENYFVTGFVDQQETWWYFVYVLDREFHLIGQFPQVGALSRYGMKDLAWDGELLWGAGEDSLYGFTRDGELVRQFDAPHNPDQFLAYDPLRRHLWTASTTSDITALDTAGNIVANFARHGSRIYGLAWDAGDLEGNNLVILHYPRRDTSHIYKMNIETGDTLHSATILPVEGQGYLYGLEIPIRESNDGSASVLFIRDVANNLGGDQLCEAVLRPNVEWVNLSPLEGIIEPDEMAEVTVSFLSAGIVGGWRFSPGSYDADVKITHNGRGGEWRVPIRLMVSPNAVEEPATDLTPPHNPFMGIYPQPFNSTLAIDYRLDRAGEIKLSLVNVAGQEVAVIDEGYYEAGNYRASLNAEAIPSGVYLLKLQRGNEVAGVKVVCMK